MSIYRLTLDKGDWNRYRVEGEHEWTAPPLACGVCGARWKTTGVAYPAVDVGTIKTEYPVGSGPLPNDAFEALATRVAPLLIDGETFQPGADFGMFSGRAKGRLPEVVWADSWTCFFHLDAVIGLRENGVSLPVLASTNLQTAGKGIRPELLEPQAIPLIDLARESLNDPAQLPCPRCGRQPGGFADFLVRRGSSLPEGVDLCRSRNCPTLYLVSPRFAEAVNKLKLSGCVVQLLPEV